MRKLRKGIFKGIIMAAFLMSMVVTVYAQTTGTTFTYGNSTVYCSMIYNWKTGNDNAYAKTYVLVGATPLRSAIFGYDKNGNLIKSDEKIANTSVTTSTISCKASKFKSSHSILNTQGTTLKRVYLNVTN